TNRRDAKIVFADAVAAWLRPALRPRLRAGGWVGNGRARLYSGMKFFIPGADSEAQAERVLEAIRGFAGSKECQRSTIAVSIEWAVSAMAGRFKQQLENPLGGSGWWSLSSTLR